MDYKKLMFAVRRVSLRTGQGPGVVLQILHSAQEDRKHRSGGQKTPFRRTENTVQEDKGTDSFRRRK